MVPKRLTVRFCIALLAILSVALIALGQSGVQYVYDELGRLVGVIDPTGNAAAYSYDSVGNLLAITRYTASQVSIIQFTPTSGPVGTVVTVYGTGFSSTISSDSLSFNGTSATITSASANQIVTTVPSGATTGTISVTTPAGSFTSTASFTVTANNSGAPSISGFVPTIGTPGTAVTVSGLNFYTSVSNDALKVNNTSSVVSYSTTTNLTATVPSAASSGRFTLTTPGGTGTSSADFFIPPSPHVASDVGFTGRLTFGQSTAVTLSTANKVALTLFDGASGGEFSLGLTSVTSSFYVSVLKPDGSTLLAPTAFTTGGLFTGATALPVTGTYTIYIYPQGSSTGSMNLKLYNAVPQVIPITLSSQLTVNFTAPGQAADLTFSGTPGQRISIWVSNYNLSSYVSVINPDGTNLVPPTFAGGGSQLFIGATTLTQTGTHTVYVNPQTLAASGFVTLTVYNVPADVTGSITAGGSPVTVTITTPGQKGSLTFSGTAGQQVSLNVTSVSISGSTVKVLKPDGSTLESQTVGTGGDFFGVMTLPSTGTYTVSVTPTGTATGSMTLNLYNVVNVNTSTSIGASPISVPLTSPGDTATITFSGTASQHIAVVVSSTTFSYPGGVLSLLNPSGTRIYSFFLENDTHSGLVLSAVSGTYTITIVPYGTNTGSLNLSITSP